MWTTFSLEIKLSILQAESTVMIGLLLDDDTLVKMVRRGDSKEECLAYINENF